MVPGIKTDLTRDTGWESLQSLDIKWITLVSVNKTWSAFAMRLYKQGEIRQSFRTSPLWLMQDWSRS